MYCIVYCDGYQMMMMTDRVNHLPYTLSEVLSGEGTVK